ncbi:hypothetical protein E2C01_012939 [Portunus trituberculatus]|uniref:Uncharacterized protein n=1 Tax=Portunus trituberculatus TaxID=210409 RepID=A0A5B7DF67_PORTR|nr:hypothetical protein [Portunus trituberculatus]
MAYPSSVHSQYTRFIKRTRHLPIKKRVLRTNEPTEKRQHQGAQLENETEADGRNCPREAAHLYTPPRTRVQQLDDTGPGPSSLQSTSDKADCGLLQCLCE